MKAKTRRDSVVSAKAKPKGKSSTAARSKRNTMPYTFAITVKRTNGNPVYALSNGVLKPSPTKTLPSPSILPLAHLPDIESWAPSSSTRSPLEDPWPFSEDDLTRSHHHQTAPASPTWFEAQVDELRDMRPVQHHSLAGDLSLQTRSSLTRLHLGLSPNWLDLALPGE